MNDFLKDMAEILDEASVTADDRLDAFEAWDSLAVLSVIAMANARYHVTLSAQQVRAVGSLRELHALLAGTTAAQSV